MSPELSLPSIVRLSISLFRFLSLVSKKSSDSKGDRRKENAKSFFCACQCCTSNNKMIFSLFPSRLFAKYISSAGAGSSDGINEMEFLVISLKAPTTSLSLSYCLVIVIFTLCWLSLNSFALVYRLRPHPADKAFTEASLRNPILSVWQRLCETRVRVLRVLQFVCLMTKMKFTLSRSDECRRCLLWATGLLLLTQISSTHAHEITTNVRRQWEMAHKRVRAKQRRRNEKHTQFSSVIYHVNRKKLSVCYIDDVWENWRIVLDNFMSLQKENFGFTLLMPPTHQASTCWTRYREKMIFSNKFVIDIDNKPQKKFIIASLTLYYRAQLTLSLW